MLGAMKTQEELRADFRRYLDEDLLDEAEAVLDQLEPLSPEEVKRVLDEAPFDDEPVTESERAGFDEIRQLLASRSHQRAG